jgi:hypothetical protein
VNTAHTSRPWRVHALPFRTCPSVLPATALAARSYLKTRFARPRLTFVTPPRDSMGP